MQINWLVQLAFVEVSYERSSKGIIYDPLQMVPMTQILRHLFYNWILTGFVIDSIWVTRVPATNLSRVDPSWLTSWKPICLRRPTSSSSLLIFLVKRSVLFKHINLNKSDDQTRMTRKRTDIVVGQLFSVAPSDKIDPRLDNERNRSSISRKSYFDGLAGAVQYPSIAQHNYLPAH